MNISAYAMPGIQIPKFSVLGIRNFIIQETGLDISKNVRERELVDARNIFFYLCRKHIEPAPSYQKLGDSVSKDHATVMHAIRNVENRMGIYPEFAKGIKNAEKKLFEYFNVKPNEAA